MSAEESKEQLQNITTAAEAVSQPVRARLGLAIEGKDMRESLDQIIAADAAGVQQVWKTQAFGADTLTLYGAAATHTQQVRLGTAIIPTYPRHPLVMAQQALAINELAPNRLRLGIGPSHRPAIENAYGLPHTAPLEHLREYTRVVRDALELGTVDHHGSFFNVHMASLHTAPIPLLISTLGLKAFRLAGEISDGALSWLCPVPYLLNKALPELRAGAEAAHRAAPPLVAHVSVAINQDHDAILAATRKRLSMYAKLPFYAHMFAEAGVPVAADGTGLDALADTLVVRGDEQAIKGRLRELLDSGLDELLLMLIPVKDEARERAQLMQLIASM